MPISKQAEGLALRLLASYPAVPTSKMAVAAIAESLDRMGLDIAEAVVERARAELAKVPSVAQLYEVAREIREKAIPPREYLALPQMEFLAEMPEDVRAKVEAMHERWHADHEPDTDEEWRRRKAATLASRRMAGVCSGAGKLVVERPDGSRVCPDCGVEVPDIEVHVPKKDPNQKRRSWQRGDAA